MTFDVSADVVALSDDQVGVDDVGQAKRKRHEFVVWWTSGLESFGDRVIRIREQREIEPEKFVPAGVVDDRVVGDSEDLCPSVSQFWGSVTEPLSFDGSTGRVCLGVPPQHCPITPPIWGADRGSGVVVDSEFGQRCSRLQHQTSPSAESHVKGDWQRDFPRPPLFQAAEL